MLWLVGRLKPKLEINVRFLKVLHALKFEIKDPRILRVSITEREYIFPNIY